MAGRATRATRAAVLLVACALAKDDVGTFHKRVSTPVGLIPYAFVWMLWNVLSSVGLVCFTVPAYRYLLGKYLGVEALIPRTRSAYRRVVSNAARNDAILLFLSGFCVALPSLAALYVGLAGSYRMCAQELGGGQGIVLGLIYAAFCYAVPCASVYAARRAAAGDDRRSLAKLEDVTVPLGEARLCFDGVAPELALGEKKLPLSRAYYYDSRASGGKGPDLCVASSLKYQVPGHGWFDLEGVFRGEVAFDGFSAPDGASKWIFEIVMEKDFARVLSGSIRAEPSGNSSKLEFDHNIRPIRKDVESAGAGETPKPDQPPPPPGGTFA